MRICLSSQKYYLKNALYIVSTPIGNLRDITLRGLDILKRVDIIICENIKITKRLLAKYYIDTFLIKYYEHNAQKQIFKIISMLQSGESVALVSDAGTPLISDPGYRLINSVLKAGYNIIPIPGPSSVLAALVGSNQATDKFYFYGFFPKKNKIRIEMFFYLKNITSTIIFLESNYRLLETIQHLKKNLGNREITLAKEMTKSFEEFRYNRLFEFNMNCKSIKGEFVIIVEGLSQFLKYKNKKII